MKLLGTLFLILNILAFSRATDPSTSPPTPTQSPTTTLKLAPPAPPVWPDQYYAKGRILIPYAHITEPFEAYIDKHVPGKGKSRIDYYNGTTITIQTDGK